MSVKSIKHNRVGMAVAFAAFAAVPGIASAIAGDANAESSIVPISTSPVWADSGVSYHACNVVNVTQSPQSVKVDLISATGAVLASSGASPVSLAAGTSMEVSGGSYTGFARCRVGNANGNNVRANITVFRWTGSYYESLATSEAR